MEMNIENVIKTLGISQKSAEALDALDGTADKQVQQSIYNEAAQLLNTARNSKGDKSVFTNTEFKGEVYDVLKDDIASIMGLEKTNTDENKISTTKEENSVTYKRIEHPNVGWVEMVKAYYPDLVEKCEGKMFGPNGAISAFKKALCTDENGEIDNDKLKLLIMSTDIPKEIKLPENINGVERKNNKPTPNPHPVYASQANYKKVAPNVYVATDSTTGATASGSTIEESKENLEKLINKKYQ